MEPIKRHKLMDLIGKRTDVFHSAVFTCFSFDPVFFSSYYMPKLRAVGIRNVMVLMDAGQYDKLAGDLAAYGSGVRIGDGRGYTLIRQECSSAGVFHPKLSLFLGQESALAFVGSGNLTYGGMAYNDEVWGAFRSGGGDGPAFPVISSVWRYLQPRLASAGTDAVRIQTGWLEKYCPWLSEPASSSGFTDGNGVEYTFAANAPGRSVLSCLKDAVGGDSVTRISVVSPFYDVSGSALRSLADLFRPEAIDCHIDDLCGTSPHKADGDLRSLCSFYRANDASRKTHAKIIQIGCRGKTVLAVGSANVTTAALGTADGSYSNDEADIIVTGPAGTDYIGALGFRKGAEPMAELPVTPAASTAGTGPAGGHPKVIIRSCEYDGESYSIVLDGPACGITLVFTGADGAVTRVPVGDCEERFSVDASTKGCAVTVHAEAGEEKVSNDSIVINCKEVYRGCPDKALSDQETMIAGARASGVWHLYLEKILGSVTFDDAPKGRSGGSGSGRSGEKEADGREFSTEEYNRTHYTGDTATGELLGRNVKDYLADALRIVDDEDDNDETEELSQDAIDKGDPKTKSQKKERKKQDEPVTEKKLIEKLKTYLSDLYSYYGGICGEMDKSLGGTLLGRLTSMRFFRAPRAVDYIRAMNAVLSLSLMSSEEVVSVSENGMSWIRGNFIRIVGRFLLVYRKEQERTEIMYDAREEFVSCVLVLASCMTWGVDRDRMKVLLLNLMELFHGDIEAIGAAERRFGTDLELSKLTPYEDSMAYVHEAVESYLKFLESDRDSLKTVISTSWKTAIIYKDSVGFLLCRDFDVNRTKLEPALLPYSMSAFSPGFLDAKPVEAVHGRIVVLAGRIR